MATKTNTEELTGISSETALSGILALLIDEREERTRSRQDAPKTEVLLAQAGLSADEIARVTGKKYNTVWRTISREKKVSNG